MKQSGKTVIVLFLLGLVGVVIGVFGGRWYLKTRGQEKVEIQSKAEVDDFLTRKPEGLTGVVMKVKKKIGKVPSQRKVRVEVVSWDPRMADVSYKDERGRVGKHRLILLETAFLLRKSNGSEELVMKTVRPFWDTVFCPGDKLEVTVSEDKWKRVVNLGPRKCAKQ